MKNGSMDLTSLLASWRYDEENTVRRIRADDGREVLQVRLPLGIEQYEIHGRPDGKRPMKRESWLHYNVRKADLLLKEGREFALREDDFTRLHREALLYYHRYVLLFQIREYQLCARDTRRNLKLLEFVSRHAAREKSEELLQYRPYIHRMNVMSRALDRIQEGDDIVTAVRILRRGIREIEEMELVAENEVFTYERSRSLKSLKGLLEGLAPHARLKTRAARESLADPGGSPGEEAAIEEPDSGEEALEREMARAVQEEDYERAALIRDEIARRVRDRAAGGEARG
jgi:hypothetical protein